MRPELREALLDQLNKWSAELGTKEDDLEFYRIGSANAKQLGLLGLSALYEFLQVLESHQNPDGSIIFMDPRKYELARRLALSRTLGEARARLTNRIGDAVWDLPGPGVPEVLEDPILEEIEG